MHGPYDALLMAMHQQPPCQHGITSLGFTGSIGGLSTHRMHTECPMGMPHSLLNNCCALLFARLVGQQD